MSTRRDAGRLPRPFGPYTLVRRIAVGGMAEVYVAVARGVGGFEKLVALKLIHPEHSEDDSFVRMLIDEAKLTVMLTHANIAQTFDLGCVDRRYFMVLEYVDGADLARLLDSMIAHRRPMPVEAALFISNRIAQALDYAHRKTDPMGRSLRVIHRDVSPQNILVSREGDVKLTDFGIAKAALRTSETEVGVIKGKYCYMSPEQAWADPIDHRSDIFSAGAVLYELITGRMLFSPDDNLPQLLERVRRADYVPASTYRPDLPSEVEAVLARALAARPDERYESAADFAFDLERVLWMLDRTWGSSKLKNLVQEFVPEATDTPEEVVDEPTGRTVVTKVEGQIGKMNSREFVPESSASVLFSAETGLVSSTPPPPPQPRPSTRPSLSNNVRNLVERASMRPDPRSDLPPPPSGRDDEEEVTTFFQKGDFDLLRSASNPPVDESPRGSAEAEDEATLVDGSGDMQRKLAEMVSLGGARAASPAAFDPRESRPVTTAFVPPAPAWPKLPFVGPPLPVAPAPTVTLRANSSRGLVWVAAAVAFALVLLVATFFATR